ncbi:MAG: aminotransferase class III-fold pyridoxal phosphate-dependent enzyme [Thermoanaerobaculales bacterium]|jgi:glutamate-1-semialdehyde 2,1-aminomutase|nr:aminotransferase class III-fold pyridoxal phosphate-dependent enzyme [Thermoanaerobaculales bacterium]
MTTHDYSALLTDLADEHRRRSPRSAAIHAEACRFMIDGGSHTLRLLDPFPPRITEAHGGWIADEDGHRILDLWQGHLANLLGHNPEVVGDELARAFASGFGAQSGLVDALQVELAALVCRLTGAERVRFTTSGTLSTMYSVLLARSFTGRSTVMKAGGGWHGAQPMLLKGVAYRDGGVGFGGVDSTGLPTALTDRIAVTRYNDPQRLADDIAAVGDDLACLILEPMLGAGGTIAATGEYLRLARELCTRHGALLILDEMITGFRFHPGGLGALHGVEPDLAIYGKALGGGMPVAAVAGRADVMAEAGRAKGRRVAFSGGTYSAHPASMLAARVFLGHVEAHAGEIYPRLGALGAAMRSAVEDAFAEAGILARCTGAVDELDCGSSLVTVHFPHHPETSLATPDAVFDPARCDVALRHDVLALALLVEDVNLVLAHGAAATTHGEGDVGFLGEACRRAARRIARHR